ncbi:MAG: aminotransferase class I/II-fold pyridoxal phosphate-dependent enzyme [Phycisphaerae bacterium]|nr:aminotransferase class I/II-fold pyridoxal phosphate-dependent enzyme [Phycisphaerae bacterium]
MKRILAQRTAWIDTSGIRKVFALAASLKDPVNFSIGQPDFEIPQPVKAAAVEAVEQGYNRYSQTVGEDKLLRTIKRDLSRRYGWDDPGVLVTSGVSGGLLLAFLTLIDPGDEVIIPDPYFVIYKHVINMIGGRCVFVDSYPDFRLPVKGIAEAITDKTKLIILNSPANPTGAVYGEEDIRQVAAIASDADVLVLSDEIYDAFCYDGPCPSIADFYPKTLLLKGFSKSYGMTGWRMGYATGSGAVGEVIEQMTKLQQYTFVCAPTPFQHAAAAALDCDITAHVADYRKKRDMIYDGLKDTYELVRPQGAFYAFAKVPPWAGSGTRFVEKAIANNLLVIPGGVFSERDTHFRISYATSNEKIERGIEILRKLTEG